MVAMGEEHMTGLIRFAFCVAWVRIPSYYEVSNHFDVSQIGITN